MNTVSHQKVHQLRRLEKSQNEQGSKRRRRVVVLAGPHKTASTSIQENIAIWTSSMQDEEDHYSTPPILPEWKWPVPSFVSDYCNDAQNSSHLVYKGFYPLLEAMSPGKSTNRAIFQDYTKEEVVQIYREEMERIWELDDGRYNLVLGSEAMDRIALDNDRNEKILEKLLNVFPLEYHTQRWNQMNNADIEGGVQEQDITFVVNYRAPRVKHLISIWHQCCIDKLEHQTFSEFLQALPEKEHNSNRLHILDSLNLSKKFLERGLNTVLLDMSGVVDKMGYDISDVIACDVLKVHCTDEKEIIVDAKDELDRNTTNTKKTTIITSTNAPNNDTNSEVEEVTPIVANVKSSYGDMGGITEEQLQMIDLLLRRFDCTHSHILEHDKMTVLYGFELYDIISECPHSDEEFDALGYPRDLKNLGQQIAEIATFSKEEKRDDADDYYYHDTDEAEEE